MKELIYLYFKEYYRLEAEISRMKKITFFEGDDTLKEKHEKEIIDLEILQSQIKIRIDLAFDILLA